MGTMRLNKLYGVPRGSRPKEFFKAPSQLKDRLTGQESSQCSPLHPGEHVQMPSIGSHAAPLVHKHVRLHPRPHVPLEQRMEQSTPCQPGVRWSTDTLNCTHLCKTRSLDIVILYYS